MVRLNKTEAGLLWLCGLVAFALVIILVVTLAWFWYKRPPSCPDQPTCPEQVEQHVSSCPQAPSCRAASGKQHCCQCAGDNAPFRESKPGNDVAADLVNNQQIERLITAIESLDFSDHVTETGLRWFLAERMKCGNDLFDMSEFIRFDWRKDELGAEAKAQIENFMDKPRQIKQMQVFGFASPDGEDSRNKGLSQNRINVVVNEIKNVSRICPTCTQAIGEHHRINGIANSRSVVIAACRAARGEDGTDKKPETTAPACPAPD